MNRHRAYDRRATLQREEIESLAFEMASLTAIISQLKDECAAVNNTLATAIRVVPATAIKSAIAVIITLGVYTRKRSTRTTRHSSKRPQGVARYPIMALNIPSSTAQRECQRSSQTQKPIPHATNPSTQLPDIQPCRAQGGPAAEAEP